jgi:hypothetical protein
MIPTHSSLYQVGHWLGLYHTFEGDCYEGPSDYYVSNTLAHDGATEGCRQRLLLLLVLVRAVIT